MKLSVFTCLSIVVILPVLGFLIFDKFSVFFIFLDQHQDQHRIRQRPLPRPLPRRSGGRRDSGEGAAEPPGGMA